VRRAPSSASPWPILLALRQVDREARALRASLALDRVYSRWMIAGMTACGLRSKPRVLSVEEITHAPAPVAAPITFVLEARSNVRPYAD
jgi:hypothetical protein